MIMLAFISGNFPTIAVGAVVLALVGLALWSMHRAKKKGAGCACGCGGCPHAESCRTKK